MKTCSLFLDEVFYCIIPELDWKLSTRKNPDGKIEIFPELLASE